MTPGRSIGVVSAACAALLIACTRGPTNDAPLASSAAVAPTPSTAPSAKPSPEVWYAGTWSGSYDSSLHRIELPAKQGGLPDWAADPGKDGVGQGTLTVAFDSNGVADGKATGALGEHRITGAADGDAVALRFLPSEPGRWSGTLVGRHDGGRVTGTLNAASGDGRAARVAAVMLTKATPAP